jgi:ABC-type branched-subunit amino acid transport system ATPase component/branched-subunit amino acid ABC-type transport system permease component
MEFVNLTVSGAVSGAIYALLAIGLVLSFATSRIFNFGHAATAWATAYVYFQLHTALGWNEYLTLAVVLLVFAPGMGLIWDRLIFSKLSDAEESTKIVAGVGVLIVVPALVVFICDLLRDYAHVGIADISQVYQTPGVLPAGSHKISNGLTLSNDQLGALGASFVLFLVLWALLRFSRLGLRMRSAVDAPALARMRGINTSRVSTLSWVLSFFLAGVAGVFAAPLAGGFGLVSDNYTAALFVALTAAVLANLRSIPIAFFVALGVGAARNLVVAYVNGHYLGSVGARLASIHGLTGATPYLILFVALLAIGRDRKTRAAGTSTAVNRAVPDYQSDLSRTRRALPRVALALLVLVPGLFFADGIWRQVIISGFATAIILLSFTVVTGIGGMISLAQGSFATAAALTTGLLLHHGLPFLPAALVGVLVASGLGALVALPAMRLGGLMLTFATLALGLLATSVLFSIVWFGNGPSGWQIPRPELSILDLHSDRTMMITVFILMLLVAWTVSNLERSASGRAMAAVRTAEPAAAASAISPQRTKLLIFVISAAIAGLGGILAASVYGTSLGTDNPPPQSFLWLAAVVVFGVSRPFSAMVAGVVTVVFPRVLLEGIHIGSFGWNGTTNDLIPAILFGLGAITLADKPNGILAFQQARARIRRDAKRARLHPEPSVRAADVDKRPSKLPVDVRARTAGAAGEQASTHAAANAQLDDRLDEPVLQLRDVRASYGEVEVLRGISLDVQPGSTLAVLGANGAGKSTLCALIAGVVPAVSGQVIFAGEDITRLSAMARAERGIVLVPESRGVFPSLTVEENLAIWLPARADREAAYDAFEALRRRRSQHAGNLSGGEQQMLSLAPFLVRRPQLLISDEPSLGLAQIVTADIMAALQRLQAEGTTIILVEEKARDVLTVADYVGALQRGRLQWVIPRKDVDEERIAAAYLGLSTVVAQTT